MKNLLKEPSGFKTAREILNPLQILFFTLISLPLVLFFIVYLMYKSGSLLPTAEAPAQPVLAVIAIVGFGCLILGQLVYMKRKKAFRAPVSLRIRLELLYRARVQKYLIQEVGVVVSVMAYVITGEASMQALYLGTLIIMGLSNPTIFNIMNDLKLNKEEATICRRNQAID